MYLFSTLTKKLNIVWLKRDLRTSDHEPFFHAENHENDYIAIYIFEPKLLSHPDSSLRHQQFIYHSILDMNASLQPFNRHIHAFYANADEVFSYLTKAYSVAKIFSYQESGIKVSWERDKRVAEILKNNGVEWCEFENQSVKRGVNNRVGWDKDWYLYAHSERIQNAFSKSQLSIEKSPFDFDIKKHPDLEHYPKNYQPAGQSFAVKYLGSFLDERGKNYSKHISSPQKSRVSCSRLSAYLAWGNISVREVFQKVKNAPNYKSHKRSFDACLARLKWRSHFIQKFETDCNYELLCVNKGYEKMVYDNNDSFLQKWKEGKTGFPLVDASMRCLINNGWINFRMRAMLVSFLCHHLNQDWRRGVYHIAQLFLDYEPGIHFTQFQMQAGVTGINSIRIYNPIKQSIEKDPEGGFIKKWVPELRELDTPFIHRPWEMTPIDLLSKGIKLDYPAPIVEPIKAVKTSRSQLWSLRKDPLVKEESKKLLRIHVRPSVKNSRK